eukprot:2129130-Prymnesium_polylepis.1
MSRHSSSRARCSLSSAAARWSRAPRAAATVAVDAPVPPLPLPPPYLRELARRCAVMPSRAWRAPSQRRASARSAHSESLSPPRCTSSSRQLAGALCRPPRPPPGGSGARVSCCGVWMTRMLTMSLRRRSVSLPGPLGEGGHRWPISEHWSLESETSPASRRVGDSLAGALAPPPFPPPLPVPFAPPGKRREGALSR